MYCQKCGVENQDGSKFCNNCAEALVPTENSNKEKVNNKQLFSAHLLNIISCVVLILSVIFIIYAADNSGASATSTTTHSSNGYTYSKVESRSEVTVDTSSASTAYVICAVDAIVVILGLAIYFKKTISSKKALSYIYLVASFILTGLFFFIGIDTIAFTCGLGFISTITGILQIIAGCKFVSALKND